LLRVTPGDGFTNKGSGMSEFRQPPKVTTHEGKPRRVGFEIEYAGVDLEQSAEIVRDITGGEIHRESPFRYKICDTSHGDYTIEVDANLLQDKKYEKYLRQAGIDIDKLDLRAPVEKLIKSAAATLVPNEIVSPPLPLDAIALVDDIRAGLVQREAHGTQAFILYGFGVHMNPELPDTRVETLLAYLQAFVLLYDWICEKTHVDWTRRIGPYINPYPKKYITLILSPGYQPDIENLVQDYVRHIPSRNHALDMLPALVWMQGDKLLQQLKEPELIKPRPAFHYRLPNCLLDDPGWRIADEWNYWIAIEELANDSSKLKSLAGKYLAYHDSVIRRMFTSWTRIVDAQFN
jgi:hypothetical protein